MTQHELDAIIQGGEGYKVEFKRNINTDVAREIVAFANSSGGRLFIGIEDDGVVHGLQITNEVKSRMQMMARDCDPAISVELEVFNEILIIHVLEGKDKPYRCTNGFYVRSGASSVKLSTQEIIDFIKTEGRIRFENLYVATGNSLDRVDEIALKRYVAIDIKEAFDISDKRIERVIVILRQLAVHQSLDVEAIAAELSTTDRTVRNDLNLLIEHGWINSSGSTKGKNYELSELGKERMARSM